MQWPLEHTYVHELAGLFADAAPTPVAEPRLLALNEPLAHELGLEANFLRTEDGVAVLAGNAVPDQAHPIAQAYAGHQFGQFSGALGDGRALLLGELTDAQGQRRDLALKGSGRTPFSRGGDGRAAIGPVLREYLMSEAMHALGIPTTRSLAAVATGEVVRRQPPEPGAVLTRVADSHLRVGTFELVRITGDVEAVTRLADYARARHYPDVGGEDPLDLLAAVAQRQAELIARWLSVGFIHGVMNTDNMTISGETIDYGPCAFLDHYDPNAVFSSIDHQGRYRYSAQPAIGAWNLARLAETLIAPLGEERGQAAIGRATTILDDFMTTCRDETDTLYARKLGLGELGAGDTELISDLHTLMEADRLDFTLTFRRLANVLRGETEAAREHALDLAAWDAWQDRWLARTKDHGAAADAKEIAHEMDSINPAYIPRNHLVEEALGVARAGDLGPFEALVAVLRAPFVERPGLERYAEPAPDGFTDGYQTFCGT